jgi:hypothetical protein
VEAICNRLESTRKLLRVTHEGPVCRSVPFGHGIVEDYDLIAQISETKIDYALSVRIQNCLIVGQSIRVVSVLLGSVLRLVESQINSCPTHLGRLCHSVIAETR